MRNLEPGTAWKFVRASPSANESGDRRGEDDEK
jgi:hypothetical protein